MTFTVNVKNELKTSRRIIHINYKSREEILHQQSVSYARDESGNGEEEMNEVSLSLGEIEGEEDYVEISVDDQPGDLGPCKIQLEPIVPFRFIPAGDTSLTVIPPQEGEEGEITTLKIPSGPPTWKLEIIKPTRVSIPRGVPSGTITNVTVSDDPPGEGD